MSCINTAVCWSVGAPFSIHFVNKEDAIGLPTLRWITEKEGVLIVTMGLVRMPFNSRGVVLCVPSSGHDLEFRIETRRIKKIVDWNGYKIYG